MGQRLGPSAEVQWNGLPLFHVLERVDDLRRSAELKAVGSRVTAVLTISSDQASLYDVRAAYLAAGYPSGVAANVVVLIAAGKTCRAGIDEGTGWTTGTVIFILNFGYILGAGGAGGDGASLQTSGSGFSGAAGSPGSDALVLRAPTVLDTASGFVFGGGGGGGGGGATQLASPVGPSPRSAGGGGGGGIGNNGAAGGDGGDALSGVPAHYGSPGTAGSGSAPGVGGAGGTAAFAGPAGDGGNGGSWGESGGAGEAATGGAYNGSGGAGGSAGYAIRKNGNVLLITGGNDATHIKGAVA